MKKLKKFFTIIYIITILQIIFIPISKCANKDEESSEEQGINETIEGQQNEFGINDFIEEAQKYSGEFFQGVDIGEILNSAIKGEVDNQTILQKFFSVLGKEVITGLKALGSILVIIVIHSILKSISESLENDGISKLIYYVQYILIVTIIMTNISDIVKLVQDTTSNLVGFMNLLVPLLISLMLYTGNIATSSILEPIILFMINFIGNVIQTIIIPIVLVFTSLVVISKISDNFQIQKISGFIKSGVVWFLGIILTIFVGVVSLEGTLSSSVDGITAKTAKAVVSSAVPVVGKILGDAVDTVLGSGIILKNAVGLVGVIIIIGICIMPIIKLAILTIAYKLLSAITEPIADKKIVGLIDQMADIFKIFLAVLCAISVMLIIGTALVLKISNTGMMYR